MNIAAHRVHDSRQYDGYWVGKTGQPVAPDAAPPEPLGEAEAPLVYYVNGISTDVAKQMDDMRRIARERHCKVLGIHNATGGHLRDLGQCVADKINAGHNPAVVSLKKLLKHGLESGMKVALVGHSQGALVCSRALTEMQAEDRQAGLSETQIRDKYQALDLETAGGAAYSYPAGPHYHHKVNWFDPVALLFGVGVKGAGDAPIERIAKFNKPYLKEGDSYLDAFVNLFDRTVHGTEVYYGL